MENGGDQMQTKNPITLKGKACVVGKAEGEAVVIQDRVSLLGEINLENGSILKPGPEHGKNIAGKVFVYYSGKGSSGDTFRYWRLQANGVQPAAVINVKADSIHVQGAIVANIPMVCKLDRNPLEVIKTGDYVKVEGGNVTVWPR
jgi:predicted aconitase with swiveling domain